MYNYRISFSKCDILFEHDFFVINTFSCHLKSFFLLTCRLMVKMGLLLTIIRHIQVLILDIVCSFELYIEVGINCRPFSIRVYIN